MGSSKTIFGDTMKEKSIWLKEIEDDLSISLNKDLEVDVLIIGGGITGLSTAYNLIHQGLKVCLVERNSIGSGITSKSTAKITILQENIYSKLKTFHGKSKSFLYYQSQKFAIERLINTIQENHIECDLEESNSYLYITGKSKLKKIKKEMKLLKDFNEDVEYKNKLPDGTYSFYNFMVKNAYVFHPLKYLNALKCICRSNGIDIYEKTKVDEIKKIEEGYECNTNSFKIKAKYIVIASHYPYFISPFYLPLKSKLQKSYIKAFPTVDNLKFNAINIDDPIKSIRYYTQDCKTYKIVLFNSHNISVKNDEQNNFNTLIDQEQHQPEYVWSNIDITTNDYLPFIGWIDERMLIGTGYNTWGMTNGTIAGQIISDCLLKRDNPYIGLFDPKRKVNLGKVQTTFGIIFANAYSFIKSKVFKKKNWYSSNVKIERINGKTIGIYTDLNQIEHKVELTCPHLKCSLVFNEVERTWDCPCHGSRFDMDGNCIEGPSKYNIAYKE